MRQLAEAIRLGVHVEAERTRRRPTNDRVGNGIRSRHDRLHATIARSTETVFQGAPVQYLDRSLACQGNHAAMLQIGNGAAHGLDRDREIIGDIIAGDRQFHLPPGFRMLVRRAKAGKNRPSRAR